MAPVIWPIPTGLAGGDFSRIDFTLDFDIGRPAEGEAVDVPDDECVDWPDDC